MADQTRLNKLREAFKEDPNYPEGSVVTLKHARSCPCPVEDCYAAPHLWQTFIV